MVDIKHFEKTHFKAVTISGRKFVYCPVGNICSWHPGDYDNSWCHWCQLYFSEIPHVPTIETKQAADIEDLPVCPIMRCSSFCPFPDGVILPCAKHGTMMIPYSEAPLRKHIYRWCIQKLFKIRYVTGKKRI